MLVLTYRWILLLTFLSHHRGIASEVMEPPLLTYLPQLEQARLSAPLETMERVGLVDVMHTPLPGEIAMQEEPLQDIALCHFAHLFEATLLSPDNVRSLIVFFGSWEAAAAIALAAEHLNTGNGIVVKQVEGLNQKCNIRFTLESFDNENISQNVAVEEMIELTDRIPVEGRLPCAIIGPYTSRNVLATALLLGIRGYPQMSPSAGAHALELKAQYPLFGRTVPSNQ